jgi:hypothetical protein
MMTLSARQNVSLVKVPTHKMSHLSGEAFGSKAQMLAQSLMERLARRPHMNLFASCPDCKLSLQLLPPITSEELETRLLMNSTELLPLTLNEQARWLCRCPYCWAEFVAYRYFEDRKIDGDVFAFVRPLQEYRDLRESNLRKSGWHLGEMLLGGFFPGFLLSCLACCVASLFFSSINHKNDLIMFATGSLLCLIFLGILAQMRVGEIVVFELITRGLGPFVLTSVWFLIAWLVSSIHLLLVFGATLPCWIVSMHFILKRIKAEALIAVAQELLQLEPLPVMPQYSVAAKSPYR